MTFDYSPLPNEISKKLSWARWLKDFEKEIDLSDMPVLEKWYHQRFASLTDGESLPDKKMEMSIAILGILHSRFSSVDIDLPDAWVDGWNCRKEYSLTDLDDIIFIDISKIDARFSSPEEYEEKFYYLRNDLAAEFADIFLSEVRKVAESTRGKSSASDIVERNARLRELQTEFMRYSSVTLSNAFSEKLPEFIRSIKTKTAKDPGLDYTLSKLEAPYSGVTEWKLLKEMFDAYFTHLSGMVKGSDEKTVKILRTEIFDCLNDLLRENKRLNRKLKGYEGE